jgi:Peptidase family S41
MWDLVEPIPSRSSAGTGHRSQAGAGTHRCGSPPPKLPYTGVVRTGFVSRLMPPLSSSRFSIAAAALGVALAGCASQTAAPRASDDLRGLVQFLEQAHPRPYAFVEPGELDALVEEESRRLDALAAPDDLEVGLAFHRVLARLGDGHLALALPIFQPGPPGQAPPLSLLPVVPKRIGATVYVDAVAAAAGLPRGTALVAIDDVAIDDIWTELTSLVLVDANHPTAQRAALERSFARHYHLAYGMRPSYRVRVRLPAGETRELTLPGVERTALTALVRHSAPLWGTPPPAPTTDPPLPPWPSLHRLDATTSLLRMPSFGILDQAEYARRVDELFAALGPAGAGDTLILDLRGNEGGLRTHGIAVLNHVLARPYAQWAQMAVRLLRIPAAFRDRVVFLYGPEAVLADRFGAAPERDGRRVVVGDPLADTMTPRGPGYPGRLIAFIDGATSSAAAELVAALRAYHPGAVLIGEETGSECRGHVGELPVTYTTPTRRLVVLISLIELTHVPTPGCQPGHGFAPDVAITYDDAAFLAGRDPYLEVVAALPPAATAR